MKRALIALALCLTFGCKAQISNHGLPTGGTAPPPPPECTGPPGVTTTYTPANGSTVSNPVTFGWHSIAGAKKYRLDWTTDSWVTSHDDSTLSATTYTTSAIVAGSSVLWNVSVGNACGWSAFSHDSSFTISGGVTPSPSAPDIYASPAGTSPYSGTLAAPFSFQMALDSIGSRAGLDTCFLLSGTYTQPLQAKYSGSSAHPLCFAGAPGSYANVVTNTYGAVFNGVNYVHYRNVWFHRTDPAAYHVLWFNVANYNKVDSCRFFGGSSKNTYTEDDMVKLDSANYNRFLCSYFDNQDSVIVDDGNDGYRTEGIAFSYNAVGNVLEQDTVVNVSHYGIKMQHGIYGSVLTALQRDTWNIARRCVVHNCHVDAGGTDYSSRGMFEDCTFYAPGGGVNYRGGLALEATSRYYIYRFNRIYNDTLPYNGGNSHWVEETSSISTQSYAAQSFYNIFYRNAFLGKSQIAKRQDAILTIYDYPTGNPGVDSDMGGDSFIDNFIGYPNATFRSVPFRYQQITIPDTGRGNCLWAQTPGDTVACNDAGPTYYTLAAFIAAYPTFNSTNVESAPGYVDSVSTMKWRNFTTTAGSYLVDRGEALTTVAALVSNSATMYVKNSTGIHAAWSVYDSGDSLLIGGTVRCKVSAVSGSTVTLTAPISCSNNARVDILATYNAVDGTYTNRITNGTPDIGPYER
jgi:hypothetical protein